MHHKRKGPKSTRAGCLMCKPHKRQGTKHKEREYGANFRRVRIARAELHAYGFGNLNHGVK